MLWWDQLQKTRSVRSLTIIQVRDGSTWQWTQVGQILKVELIVFTNRPDVREREAKIIQIFLP